MSKHNRSEQSRINGKKSKGPTTPDGKARSSRNSLKHGFAASINNVLSIEDESAFTAHVQAVRNALRPQDYFEQTLVDQLASISWRQSRLVGLETSLIDAQLALQNEPLKEINSLAAGDPYFQLALTWQALARQPQPPFEDPTTPPDSYEINSIELVRRYLTSLDRQCRNVLLNLRQYRKDLLELPQKNQSAPAQPNDPEPPPANQPVNPPDRTQMWASPRPPTASENVEQSPSAPESEPMPRRWQPDRKITHDFSTAVQQPHPKSVYLLAVAWVDQRQHDR